MRPEVDPPAEPSEYGIAGEDGSRLRDAELDAAYRWASGAVRDRHVLVVGCGAGHGVEPLLAAGAKTVVGVDSDERLVETGSRLYGERARFATAEAAALPLASGSFDAVLLFDLAQPEPDTRAVISELIRVLEPDAGILLVSLPLATVTFENVAAVATGAQEGPGPEGDAQQLAAELAERFAHTRTYRRRISIAATVAPSDDHGSGTALEEGKWLGGSASEDRTALLAASNSELPELSALASLVSVRDLRAHEESLLAWEYRARRAEAEGSAKHWELVAAREAQRRLRMRLHQLEHRPLRVLSRIIRGKPAKLGEGPPLRASEIKPEHWD